MIQKLEKLIQNLTKINIEKVLFTINSEPSSLSDVELYIRIRLDTKGITSDGIKLRTDTAIVQNRQAYAIKTEQIKGKSDFVNLRDTGEFHDSIIAKALTNGDIEIKATFKDIYDNFQILFPNEIDFENKILSLSQSELKEYVKLTVLPELEKIFKNIFNV